jgi:hypothetical protein
VHKRKRRFKINDKINILAQADAYSGPRVELKSCFRLSVSTPNTTVKNHKEIKDVQCLAPQKERGKVTTGTTKESHITSRNL